MNILIVSQYFYPEDFKVNDIAFEMKKRGHSVTVLTGKPNYPKGKFYEGYSLFKNKKEFIKGVEVIRCPIIPRGSGSGLRLLLNYLSFVYFAIIASVFRIKGSYDVIFVHEVSPITVALPAIFLKFKFKCPMYLWVLDLWPESVVAAGGVKSQIVIKVLRLLVKYIYKQSDKILISSKGFKKSVQDIIGVNKQIVYFPNWAEDIFTQKINNSNVDVEFPKGFNILFAGNIGESQNIEVIVEAAKLTKGEINWLFVGDGRKRKYLENSKSLNTLDNVYIYGRYPLAKMPAFFNKADVMLVSLKDEEIFNLVVPAKMQAYLASGKAILGAIGKEARDMILNAEVGCACEPSDFKSLAKYALKMKYENSSIKNYEKRSLEYYNSNFEKELLMNKIENILAGDIS